MTTSMRSHYPQVPVWLQSAEVPRIHAHKTGGIEHRPEARDSFHGRSRRAHIGRALDLQAQPQHSIDNLYLAIGQIHLRKICRL